MSGLYQDLKDVMDKLSTKRPVLEHLTEAQALRLFGPMMELDIVLVATVVGAKRVLEIIERFEVDQVLADDAS